MVANPRDGRTAAGRSARGTPGDGTEGADCGRCWPGSLTAENAAQLLSACCDGLLVVCDGRVAFASDALVRLLREPDAPRIVGRQFLDLLHDDDRAAAAAHVRGAQAVGAAVSWLAGALRRGDGTAIDVETAAVRAEHGDGPAVLVIVRDVTKRREAEDALRSSAAQLLQAQKMEPVGRLAGGVAHDFNNILTGVLGYSDLVLRRLHPRDPLRADVEEIRKAGERAADLTRKLLAFSRRQILESRVLDIGALVSEMEGLLRRVIGEDLDLQIVRAPNLGHVYADPGQIEQVVMNLAVNARDAMPTGGILRIEIANAERTASEAGHGRAPGRTVCITVSDTGVGMTDDVKAHLFEPFFTTKEPGKGTGLGLSTVYGIVQQSRGHVAVDSTHGAGTRIVIHLPAVEAEAETAQPRRRASPPPGIVGNETILLVEDEEPLRRIAARVLRDAGYRVHTAEDGAAALRLADGAREAIHLLVTDVVMPNLGGPALARELAHQRPTLKVLYISGYVERSDTFGDEIPPGAAFLSKPFAPDHLVRKVRECLEASDAPGPAAS